MLGYEINDRLRKLIEVVKKLIKVKLPFELTDEGLLYRVSHSNYKLYVLLNYIKDILKLVYDGEFYLSERRIL